MDVLRMCEFYEKSYFSCKSSSRRTMANPSEDTELHVLSLGPSCMLNESAVMTRFSAKHSS